MPPGLLTIDPNTNISTLGENTGVTRRLARSGGANIFGDATDFLVNQRGLHSGQFISVVPAVGTNAAVIFVADAAPLDQNAALLVSRRGIVKRASTKKASKHK